MTDINRQMLEGCLNQTMEMAKYNKTELCRENAGKIDHEPFIVLGVKIDNDGKKVVGGAVLPIDLSNGEHPVDTIPKMLSELHDNGLHNYEWLVLLVEGYAKPSSENTTQATPKRGELEKEFLANADTDIKEGIIASLFSWTGEIITQSCFYKYNDQCLPEYGEDVVEYSLNSDETLGGRIPDLFQLFIKYCKNYNELATIKTALELNKDEDSFFTKDFFNSDDFMDLDEIPSFYSVWQVVLNELPSVTKNQKRKHKKVISFFEHCFTIKVVRECWQALKEKSKAGEIDIDVFMADMTKIMESDDNNQKEKFVDELTKKYSMSANALLFAIGKNKVPDDISELIS